MFGYEKLEVWQVAKKLAIRVYGLAGSFPAEEKSGLAARLNRSVSSIVSNIAESHSKTGLKDKVQFAEAAYDSLIEASCHVQIAVEFGFINLDLLHSLANEMETLAKQLNAYRNYQIRMSKTRSEKQD